MNQASKQPQKARSEVSRVPIRILNGDRRKSPVSRLFLSFPPPPHHYGTTPQRLHHPNRKEEPEQKLRTKSRSRSCTKSKTTRYYFPLHSLLYLDSHKSRTVSQLTPLQVPGGRDTRMAYPTLQYLSALQRLEPPCHAPCPCHTSIPCNGHQTRSTLSDFTEFPDYLKSISHQHARLTCTTVRMW
jgi:hypothetical protein